MIGPSCSGKSTWIEQNFDSGEDKGVAVVSADHFFYNNEGEYKFDGRKLGEAHADCFRSFETAVKMGYYHTIIVDNTNLQNWERAPYVMAANAYGSNVNIRFVHMQTPLETIISRENGHNVPEKSKRAMISRFERPLPFWGSYEVVES